MKRILISLILVTLLLLTACTSMIDLRQNQERIEIDGFSCTYVNREERDVCRELAQSYLIYATLKDQNVTGILKEIERLGFD